MCDPEYSLPSEANIRCHFLLVLILAQFCRAESEIDLGVDKIGMLRHDGYLRVYSSFPSGLSRSISPPNSGSSASLARCVILACCGRA